MYPEASESVTAVRHLIRTAERHGLALEEGPTASQPAFSARIGVPHAQRLWERAVHVIGPALPLRVAETASERLSLPYFAAMSCRTVGEALQLLVEHWRYVTEAVRASTVRSDGALHLRLEATGALPLGGRLTVEYLLAALVRAGRELTAGAWRPTAVVLGHHPPLGLERWADACGAPARIAEVAGLVIAEPSLALPIRAELSRAAGRFFRELLDFYTPRASPAPTLAARVAGALGRSLGSAAPTVELVAAELALSPRSLHRQLAAEGTSYQRVLDTVRCDEAIRQTVEERRPFKAIAVAIGFSDSRAFRRAFKRWTGTTPQQFRLRGA